MRFQFDDKRYFLTFKRKREHIEITRFGKKHTILSQFPYTTVTLWEMGVAGSAVSVEFAKVGCLTSDSYSNEQGRVNALRELNRKLRKLGKSEQFRSAMWNAYLTREKAKNLTPAEQKVKDALAFVNKALTSSSAADYVALQELKKILQASTEVIDTTATAVEEPKLSPTTETVH